MVELECVRGDQRDTIEIRPAGYVSKDDQRVSVASSPNDCRWPEPRPDLDRGEDPDRMFLTANDCANLVCLKLHDRESRYFAIVEPATDQKDLLNRLAYWKYIFQNIKQMWRRLAEQRLRGLWEHFPAVLILGARQVGKTTLARASFPEAQYCDLQQPELRQLFTAEPTFQIQQRAGSVVILDEAQAVPPLFAALRGIIDSDRRRRGRFLLLGSANPRLVSQISESLAGRVGILDLDPLTALEVSAGDLTFGYHSVWLGGGFPDALQGSFRDWWEAYLRTYIERDLPSLGLSPEPLLLRRLITMLAHQQGALLNASQLGNSLGVSHHTVRRYLDVLEQTYLIRVLPPYHRNVGKRLTKSPKVYLRDTGLLHHVLNITSAEDLNSHPVCGASWETFVLEDLIRREKLENPHTQFFFWRTAAGLEADLLFDRGSERIIFEIKTGEGEVLRTLRRLQSAMSDAGAGSAYLIAQAEGTMALAPCVERRGFSSCYDWLP